MHPLTIAQILRHSRARLDLAPIEVAARTNGAIPVGLLTRLEHGFCVPTPSQLEALIELYGPECRALVDDRSGG